jgi:MazG family protein
MKEFDELIAVADKLLSPEGCPWDRKQTFQSLQPYVLEEAHEVIEAVDEGEDQQIVEELGDLLYTIIFYGKLAQKEGKFALVDIVKGVTEKLVRRHPHVFGGLKVEHEDEVVQNWERIKKEEKQGKNKKEGGVPPTLPLLVRAQKVIKRIIRSQSHLADEFLHSGQQMKEEEIGDQFLRQIARAEEAGIDSESALRRALMRLEARAKI